MVKSVFRAFDRLGNIAIVNFRKDVKLKDKKSFANKILKENPSVKTVLEKKGKVKGRLRKATTKHVAGEKTKEVLYTENNCVFRFNIDTTYFSPRLSNERKEIASKIKKGDKVLVMFAGVAPFSIVIAKSPKSSKIISNEVNRVANKYAQLNVELNKVKKKIEFWNGDIKRIVERFESIPPPTTQPPTLNKVNTKSQNKVNVNRSKKFRAQRANLLKIPKFDIIVMPRPQLKDSFLKQAFKFSKSGTRIFYYDFCGVDEKKKILDKIKDEAKKARKKIKILKTKKAGEIAPYKIRLRVDFKIIE